MVLTNCYMSLHAEWLSLPARDDLWIWGNFTVGARCRWPNAAADSLKLELNLALMRVGQDAERLQLLALILPCSYSHRPYWRDAMITFHIWSLKWSNIILVILFRTAIHHVDAPVELDHICRIQGWSPKIRHFTSSHTHYWGISIAQRHRIESLFQA